MASRYDNNKVKKLNDGRRVYRSKIYPNIPKKDTDIYVVTQGGDRLDTLAYQFYKDSALWWVIAEANNLRDGRFALDPNKELRIPINLAPILLEFRDLNSGGSPSTGGSPGGGGGGGY